MSVTESRPFTTNNFRYKYARNLACASVAVFLLGGALMLQPFSFGDNSYAESDDFDATVNVASNLSVSATDVAITDTPEASGSWLTGTSNVVVSTNNATGYKLYISSSDDQVDLINSENSKYKISNLESETTENDFKSSADLMNYYGFTTNNNGSDTDLGQITTGTYLPLTNNNNARLINATTEKKNISQTDVTFATKVDRSIPAGEYTNTITFTAIANPTTPTTLEDGLYMQDVTQDMCDKTETWTSGTTNQFTLKDSRDNNEYKVRKLKDGHCWMVQNLRLTYTSLNNNSSRTASPKTTLTADDSDMTGTTTYAMPSNAKWTGTSKTTAGAVSADVAPLGSASGSPASGELATAHGAYYTWCTATANCASAAAASTKVTTSICPKNWKLANIDDSGSSSDNNMYYRLYNDSTNGYGANYANFMKAFNYYYDSSAGASASGANYYLAGGYNPNSGRRYVYSAGSGGYWWSSTSHSSSANSAWDLRADTSSVDPAYNDTRYWGISVRCVL